MITSSNGALIEYMLKYFSGIELSDKEMLKLEEDFKGMKGDENLTNDDIFEILSRYKVWGLDFRGLLQITELIIKCKQLV